MLAGMSITSATSQVQGPAIQVQGLEKSYKELRVLRGVDFEVARGSIFALLGSNGAGKTTVVKILSTLLRADAGTARVNGFDVATQAAGVRESISLTGQFAAVDEILSGRENLVLVARLRHLKDPGAIADDLLRRFSLTEAGTRRAATYSGGMRRRLDIAMSLIGNPPVIFLDEPTTGLDPEARLEVWQAVKELAEGGTTVLLTTQYLDEAEHLADRIAILHEGRIIVNGTLAELKQLLPPAKVEYVEKQPSLEDVFLAVVGRGRQGSEERTAMTTHFLGDTAVLTGRSLRHITRSPDTIITTAITPIAIMLLFVYVFGGAIDTGTDSYVNYMLPGILLITIASGISYTAFRLFTDMQGGIFERFQSMPIARSGVLWAHVLTSLVANLISLAVVVGVALAMGFRSGAGRAGLARGRRHPRPVHPGPDLARRDPRPDREDRRRRGRVRLPADLPAVHQLGVRAHRAPCPARCAPSPSNQPVTSIVNTIRDLFAEQPVGTDIWIALAWCVGILVVAYVFAIIAYRRRIS